MRFNKSVMAFAAFAALTVFGGHSAYAADTTHTQTAQNTSTQTTTKQSDTLTVTVNQGDTLTAIAAAHNTTVDAILQQNSIADANLLEPGQTLAVTAGADKLTNHYNSLKAAAEAFITPPAPVVTQAAAATTRTVNASTRSTPVRSTFAAPASSAGNTYVWGTCTWYVKNRKPNLPNRLGNAGYNWLTSAAAAGFGTGLTPVVGAIGVESGHVVIVESVNANGTVNISEMNYAGGLGVVHYRTAPASEFKYIYA